MDIQPGCMCGFPVVLLSKRRGTPDPKTQAGRIRGSCVGEDKEEEVRQVSPPLVRYEASRIQNRSWSTENPLIIAQRNIR